ncbi:chromosome segregation protein SMC [Pseudobacillus badius]|uniref:chromosome segregation protein SMC n=1 Tax=Bacillus badius TaxID=1455 RepID=UPI0007B0A24D|nr:chromosome segregation protein SMC [Bacillus badius]KZO01637.1 chromosome segregation protein SMC [Bacillus badius]OCS90032.1 chromosome segregation protein SMC [Bacillus badius]OVE53559.1 chromosome segregation protein SMC [Bacillus badius]TDW05924.1 condensin subunit Smc [Bacillus badius]UAT31788.1 chromosome segregation protein SMC [Bacillus badius]
MFLKKLEIAGFKSFAERVSVEFVDGVTAVVGPNGSGKSNITDGIRWVLGEQSAKSLRGGKMEDVIFAGSDSRKQLNVAEVTLTLNNEAQTLPIEYNEVNVTRRVYRSGDSEYFINKRPCRLKDIVDLFMDSGLGKEAFSIIGQGKVEEILNSKPEERRAIFEEAAGVLKYKTRKKKAEKKLDETQENLLRVQDILHELEGQIEPLQMQASIARDYLDKKEEMTSYDIAAIVYEIDELHGQWEKLKSSHGEHAEQESVLFANLQKKEATAEELRTQITALDESVNDLQGVLLAASEELEKLEGRKQVLQERRKNAIQNEGQLADNLAEAKEKIKQLSIQAEQLKEKVEADRREEAECRQQLSKQQQEMQQLSKNLEAEIESLKSDYIDKLNIQASAKNERQHVKQQLEQLTRRKERLDAENKKYLAERQEIEAKKSAIEAALASEQERVTTHLDGLHREQQLLEAMKAKYEKQESSLYQAYQILQDAKSRKEMLESLEEDYSGFFQGVKEILKARGRQLSGIEGAVAEMIDVPKEYETAIEVALGSSMQHIITADERAAREAIGFLKKHRFGRATFLPLTSIKEKVFPAALIAQLENDGRFIGIAADLIRFPGTYRPAITNLLGHTVIAAHLEGANELAKLLNYRYRIVTLDGDVVNPGGSMTGGALKQKGASLISRKNELETLKAKLASMEEKTAAAEREVKKLKGNILSKEALLKEMRNETEAIRAKEQECKNEQLEWQFAYQTINSRLSIYDTEKQEFEAEQQRLQQLLEKAETQLAESGQEIEALDAQIKKLTEQRAHESTLKETIAQAISELNSKLAVKNEQLMSGNERLKQVLAELAASEQKYKQWNEDLNWLKTEMSASGQGEEEIDEAARKKRQDKEEITKLIAMRRNERMDKLSRLEAEDKELKELRRLHKAMSEAVQDEEVKINRLDVELDNRLEQLNKEYALTYEAAKEKYPLPFPIEEVRKKLHLIKLSIKELGSVNLGAIEEYERVSERYTFLEEQRADLQEAKDTLSQVIEEMDEEMTKRFKETFQSVSTQFLPVFQSLFGGGRAELRLTDPEHLLSTGVEIVAQPPGKKLQSLSLLSGGERALTAIALLFAILKVRPVPFCVLDEVEAALDEANVFRFSRYLKQFSKDTQFIVITHRKGTMEEADALYGITMQESGVSRLVSVTMDQKTEAPVS